MASLMGASVHMVAKVGDDDIGRATISNFRSRGVSTEHVSVATGVASGIAAVSVSADGQNSIVLAPGANLLLGRDDVERAAAAILGSDVLLLQNEAGPAPRARGCAGAVVAAPRVDPAANGVQRRRDGAGAGSPAGRRSTAAPRPASDSDSKAESAASARPQRPARDGVSSGPGPSVKNLPFDPRWTASPFAPR